MFQECRWPRMKNFAVADFSARAGRLSLNYFDLEESSGASVSPWLMQRLPRKQSQNRHSFSVSQEQRDHGPVHLGWTRTHGESAVNWWKSDGWFWGNHCFTKKHTQFNSCSSENKITILGVCKSFCGLCQKIAALGKIINCLGFFTYREAKK